VSAKAAALREKQRLQAGKQGRGRMRWRREKGGPSTEDGDGDGGGDGVSEAGGSEVESRHTLSEMRRRGSSVPAGGLVGVGVGVGGGDSLSGLRPMSPTAAAAGAGTASFARGAPASPTAAGARRGASLPADRRRGLTVAVPLGSDGGQGPMTLTAGAVPRTPTGGAGVVPPSPSSAGRKKGSRSGSVFSKLSGRSKTVVEETEVALTSADLETLCFQSLTRMAQVCVVAGAALWCVVVDLTLRVVCDCDAGCIEPSCPDCDAHAPRGRCRPRCRAADASRQLDVLAHVAV
jgi:hypothetical protein